MRSTIWTGIFCVFILNCVARIDASKAARNLNVEKPPPFINNLAIYTYCSCDKPGCYLYERASRLKDLYCKMHGCDHILVTKHDTMHKRINESDNHFAQYIPLLELMETSPQYEFVFITDGDMVIANLNIPPSSLVPQVCHSSQYEFFVPFDEFSYISGITAPLLRNTPKMRQYLRDLIAYSSRGNYIMSDQSAMNHLLLKYLALARNKPLEELDTFERGGSCDMYITDEYYQYKHDNPVLHWKRHLLHGRCLTALYEKWYSTRPLSPNSIGRHNTSFCLFEVGNNYRRTDYGQNWNSRRVFRVVSFKLFMVHVCGKKTFVGFNDVVDQITNGFPSATLEGLNRSTTSVFEKCVKPYMHHK